MGTPEAGSDSRAHYASTGEYEHAETDAPLEPCKFCENEFPRSTLTLVAEPFDSSKPLNAPPPVPLSDKSGR